MNLHLIVPALPPQLDGIGDYSSLMAAELARGGTQVTLITPTRPKFDPIPGVTIAPVFDPGFRSGVWAIERHVRESRPDWVVLQYNPFGYGHRGLNLSLPRVIRSIRRNTGTRVALMSHERFMPLTSVRFAIMSSWQRWQLWQLGRNADVVFFSIDPWARRYSSWFPRTPVHHLPVGSNIPRVQISRAEARRRLGINDETTVLGLFGTSDSSRLFGHVLASLSALKSSQKRMLLLYIGKDGAAVKEKVGDFPTIAQGPFPADEVSARLAAVDIYLGPYISGTSTRRGSMMAGLQHGLPMVVTRGEHTDDMLLDMDGRALLFSDESDPEGFARQVMRLLKEPEVRERIGAGARRFYEENFTWEVIARRLLSHLTSLDHESKGDNRMPSTRASGQGSGLS